ncbi:MAG: ABC transporter ATP-binding protein [Spirochaetaceae bacterium]
MSRPPRIELRSVRIRIGNVEIVRNASAVLLESELTVLCGRVGSGKTVLAQTIAGIRTPEQGVIHRNGSRIAMVFQQARHGLLGETVQEDLELAALSAGKTHDRKKDTIRDVLANLGISHLAHRYVVNLSGGEARLVAIAGAIVSGADVVFADEPFANLDWPSVQSVLRALLRLREEGATVVVITHEVEKILAHADRIIVLSNGRFALNRVLMTGDDLSHTERGVLRDAGVRLLGTRRAQTWI